MRLKKWISGGLWMMGLSGAAMAQTANFETVRGLDVFNSLFRELELYYVDTIDTKKLIEAATDYMLMDLDPYTVFIPKEETEEFKLLTTGEYGGIGAVISENSRKQIVVNEPYEGSPAMQNGVKIGDVITEVEGKKTQGMTVSEVSELLRGEPGQVVKLKIARDGQKGEIVKNITREKIIVNPVDCAFEKDGIGYIHLTSFTDKASVEVRKKMVEMMNGKELKGVILDLRDNPGGIVDEAVEICNLFVPKGQVIVSLKGRNAGWDHEYRTTREPIAPNLPVVVLVNENSASAAEIVSGALQDMDCGVIVGQQTYGKGLVQTTRPVGYDNYLKITTSKYYTPAGRCIQAFDYTDDGNAKRVPDSLTHEFKTTAGRVVRDGGGIRPDIEIETDSIFSSLVYKIARDGYIFDYVTRYVNGHPEWTQEKALAEIDANYEDFKKYLKDNGFSYKLRTQEYVDRLEKLAKIEGCADIAKPAIDSLKKVLVPDMERDMNVFKDEVLKYLRVEIARRYTYGSGAVLEGLKDNEEYKRAVELLNHNNEYRKILKK